MAPRITFDVNRVLNHFCHVSVIYSDSLPSELADGMLGNKAYEERGSAMKHERIVQRLKEAGPFRATAWYSLARRFMWSERLEGEERAAEVIGGLSVLLGLVREKDESFDAIWDKTVARLEEYKVRFQAIWSPISDPVLDRLSTYSKKRWTTDEIRVNFVDCLWGGFAWVDCLAFTPFPDMEVQKKFLAHELSELITPTSVVAKRLKEAGLDPEVSHTVVDMLAYLSIRDFIEKQTSADPERKGIRPNRKYYPAVDELSPLFENYARDPSAFTDFDILLDQLVKLLKGLKPVPHTIG